MHTRPGGHVPLHATPVPAVKGQVQFGAEEDEAAEETLIALEEDAELRMQNQLHVMVKGGPVVEEQELKLSHCMLRGGRG